MLLKERLLKGMRISLKGLERDIDQIIRIF
nr:MAG TPA: hypothetical protein [Caudoviricetes sp.]DAX00472.1 MAG TPA: hypothetical protein [Bacteriophage sp.]